MSTHQDHVRGVWRPKWARVRRHGRAKVRQLGDVHFLMRQSCAQKPQCEQRVRVRVSKELQRGRTGDDDVARGDGAVQHRGSERVQGAEGVREVHGDLQPHGPGDFAFGPPQQIAQRAVRCQLGHHRQHAWPARQAHQAHHRAAAAAALHAPQLRPQRPEHPQLLHTAQHICVCTFKCRECAPVQRRRDQNRCAARPPCGPRGDRATAPDRARG